MLLGFLLSISIFSVLLIIMVYEDTGLTFDFLKASTVILDYSIFIQ